MEQVYGLASGVKERDRMKFNPGGIRKFKESIKELFNELESSGQSKTIQNFGHYRSFFDDAIDVMENRMGDLLLRWSNPNKWEVHWVEEVKASFLNYFYSLEKQPNGFYHIVHNIEEHPEKNFLVTFSVSSIIGHSLTLPIIFKDMLRELVTNARKYSNPGGKIDIKLEMSRTNLNLQVSDEGVGIPETEIEQVVSHKFRASNIIDNDKILGSGFGLTKVYFNVQQLSGSMDISSKLGSGTTVTVDIPVPDNEFVMANFGAL
jgi:signal transduction histidine kinase